MQLNRYTGFQPEELISQCFLKSAQLGSLLVSAICYTGYRYYQVALRCHDVETHPWSFVKGICLCCSLEKKGSFLRFERPELTLSIGHYYDVYPNSYKCISILPNWTAYRHVYSNRLYICLSAKCGNDIYACGYLIIKKLLFINIQTVITHTNIGEMIFSEKYYNKHSCLLWAWEVNMAHLTDAIIISVIVLIGSPYQKRAGSHLCWEDIPEHGFRLCWYMSKTVVLNLRKKRVKSELPLKSCNDCLIWRL